MRLLLLAAALPLPAVLALPTDAAGGSLEMRSGLYLEGTPSEQPALDLKNLKPSPTGIVINYIWAVDDGMRTYYLSKQQVDAETVDNGTLSRFETFTLEHQNLSTGRTPGRLGPIRQAAEFDSAAQRTVPLQTPRGRQEIVQGVTELRPDWLRVDALNLNWDYALATATRSDEELVRLLDLATDRTDANQRLARVRFLQQSGRLALADAELAATQEQFPSLGLSAEQFAKSLDRLYGVKAIAELRRRQAAGQHELTRRLAGAFDADRVDAATFGQADAILRQYRQHESDIEAITAGLETLESELPAELRRRVAPLRRTIGSQLEIETLERMRPFLAAIDDFGLTAEQKMAIAISGFYAGQGQLVETIDEAVRIADLAAAVDQTLASADRWGVATQATEIGQREGATVERLRAILRQLRPVLADRLPSDQRRLDLTIDPLRSDGGSVRMQLPPESSPRRAAPLLVVLCAQQGAADDAIDFWAGSDERPGFGDREGYVTAAIATPRSSEGLVGTVCDAIRTIRRHTGIDSDRIYLAGHGPAGSRALELGLARPFDWAGVVSVCGVMPETVRSYTDFASALPLYLVSGELDGGTLTEQSAALERMLLRRHDVLLCEYQGRGPELYGSERERIFEWMSLHRRAPIRTTLSVKVRDRSHRDWDWLRADAWDTAGQTRSIKGRLNPGSVIVSTGNTDATAWLPAEVVNLDDWVSVSFNGRRTRRIVKPSAAAMLEDFWLRADRERLYAAKLELPL